MSTGTATPKLELRVMFKNVNTAWTGCPIGPGAQVPFLSSQYCMSFCTPLPIPLSIGLAFPGAQVPFLSSQYCMSFCTPLPIPLDWISLSWCPGTISVLSILHIVLHPPPHPPVDWISLSWCHCCMHSVSLPYYACLFVCIYPGTAPIQPYRMCLC